MSISLKKVINATKENKPYHLHKGDKRYKYSKKLKQKIGFRYEEVWNLDYTISTYILPRLSYFRYHHCSYPADVTSEDWDAPLDEMIDGFYLKVIKDSLYWTEEDRDIRKRAKELFMLYYDDLWD